jgi:hypothetical protein
MNKRYAGIAVTIAACAGLGFAVNAVAAPSGSLPTVSSNARVCVQYGQTDSVQGNVMLYDWNRSACPVGTYAVNLPTGPAGPTGPMGLTGAPGAEGVAGSPGVQGPTGSPGPVGPTGVAGATGATGPAGAAFSFTVGQQYTVTVDGNTEICGVTAVDSSGNPTFTCAVVKSSSSASS